jgi:hypothetical protein
MNKLLIFIPVALLLTISLSGCAGREEHTYTDVEITSIDHNGGDYVVHFNNGMTQNTHDANVNGLERNRPMNITFYLAYVNWYIKTYNYINATNLTQKM